MKTFDLFLSKYPPDRDLRKPTSEMLERFQGKVPAELLDFWQEYGFGNYGGGLLKIIDPTDYGGYACTLAGRTGRLFSHLNDWIRNAFYLPQAIRTVGRYVFA